LLLVDSPLEFLYIVKILQSALDMTHKTVSEIMTPLEKMDMIDSNTLIDRQFLEQLYDWGHARVPVYRQAKDYIIGFLLIKTLITGENWCLG
jgi:CBS domain containing-hemolysin-like protein